MNSNALLRPVLWGLLVGLLQAVVPVIQPYYDPATIYAMSIVLIAAVYVGFAVADGRPRVIVAEMAVTTVFCVVGAVSLVTTVWLIPVALAAHGVKDYIQHRTGFTRGTRWWPPFCAAVDWLAAAVVALLIAFGASLHL